MRFIFFLAVAATFAFAQQSPCHSRCNQQGSECMKGCMGDPKDAQRPENADALMKCVKECEQRNAQCKQGCR